MKIELEIPRRVIRMAILGVSSCIVLGGAVAYAQTNAATTTDTLVGSALNTLGNAVAALRNDVAVLQMSERVARATITATGTVTAQTGSWVTRVDHPAAGQYVVRFAPGVFATVPTCVTTANANEPIAPAIECTVTTTSMACQVTETKSPKDTAMFLLCAGS
jgi:hypothetical protein